jgi:ABC-type nitrate/sulfonate/bicarbonate transport system ATPase subunit
LRDTVLCDARVFERAERRVVVRGEDLEKRFPKRSGKRSESVLALTRVSFQILDREFVTLLGPSGCGKSTLLSIIAGIEEPTAGDIAVAGYSRDRRTDAFGYMFQSDLLVPWRTVAANVALGLESLGVRRTEARDRANELLERFGLAEFGEKHPGELSGGMRQRVALMRTLVLERPHLLLDEPFGALDALTRLTMQEWLLDVWEEHRRTVVFVTHDVEESILLSDRVLVMTPRPGRVLAEIDIDIPRPRTYETVADPEFVRLKHEVLGMLHNPPEHQALLSPVEQ